MYSGVFAADSLVNTCCLFAVVPRWCGPSIYPLAYAGSSWPLTISVSTTIRRHPPILVSDREPGTPVIPFNDLDTHEWCSAIALPLKQLGGECIVVDGYDRPDYFEVVVEHHNGDTRRMVNCCDAVSASVVMTMIKRIIELC